MNLKPIPRGKRVKLGPDILLRTEHGIQKLSRGIGPSSDDPSPVSKRCKAANGDTLDYLEAEMETAELRVSILRNNRDAAKQAYLELEQETLNAESRISNLTYRINNWRSQFPEYIDG